MVKPHNRPLKCRVLRSMMNSFSALGLMMGPSNCFKVTLLNSTGFTKLQKVLGSGLIISNRQSRRAGLLKGNYGEFVVPCCEASEVLDPSEHAFDCVAILVERGREAVLPFSVRLGRYVRGGACRFDLGANGIAVVALVAMHQSYRR